MIRKTVLEWEAIRYGDSEEEIPEAAADRIAAVAAASPLSGASGGGVLEHGRKALRARGVVGVITSGDALVEILPKIDVAAKDNAERNRQIRRRLVHMLAVALDLSVDVGQLTSLDTQNETLLEILIRIFSEKLTDAVRQGMPRRYQHHEDDLPVLRGRLDTKRQFSRLAVEPSRLACHYDVLTADIALNQIMKAATSRLSSMSRSADNQRRLRELSFVYADIAEIPRAILPWANIVIDRTNRRWLELLNLARLLLGDRFQNTSSGSNAGFSLLFEMNVLFEEYVARMLQKGLAGTELRVTAQGGRLYCLQAEEKGLFQTRPDLIVKRGNVVLQIIDTKWKRIANRVDDPKAGISQGDVYQMMAYGQLYDCDSLTLLYPHHAGLLSGDGLQADYQFNGSSRRLRTATVDLTLANKIADRLALIVHPAP
jgi:5-methylcytosine-specific restriction enzyme subunit McrC